MVRAEAGEMKSCYTRHAAGTPSLVLLVSYPTNVKDQRAGQISKLATPPHLT